MTALARKLARRIAATGPLTMADYIAACLTDPEHGYYMTREPFGPAGDFVTAPEIGQAFGELIGLWCLVQWRAAGAPADAVLAELGPGRGTLLADALRAIEGACGHVPFALHLVEASPLLRRRQRQALAGRALCWHETAATLPAGRPAWIVANEFFDALPVRQLVATAAGWRERLVDVHAGRLVPVLAPRPACATLTAALPACVAAGRVAAGRVAEIAPERQRLMAALARRLAAWGGALLAIDFHDPALPLRDSVQALAGHAHGDRFAAPGACDLAAAVDFPALARAARAGGGRVFGPIGQGVFLRRLGIAQRTRRLNRAGAREAMARLVSARAMGEHFQAMAVLPPSGAAPDGFTPDDFMGPAP